MKIRNFVFLITFLLPCCSYGMNSEKITPENFIPKLREKFSEYVKEDGYLKTPSTTVAYVFHAGSEKLMKNLLRPERSEFFVPQAILDYAFNVSVDVIKKEIEYCAKGYFVFYHGQKLDYRLLQDLKEIFYELKENKKLKDFVFVRQLDTQLLQKISRYKNSNQYLRNFFEEFGGDDYPEVSETLLPANYCFFGNSMNNGESSFAYFLLKMLYPTKVIMNQIMALFLQEGRIQEFKALIPKFKELICLLNDENDEDHTDHLLQIFIPKDKVNLIYFALPYGHKDQCGCLKKIISALMLGKQFYCNCDFNKLCQRYQVQPNNKITKIDSEQIRIMLKPEYFMNPESGIKIFKYTNETERFQKYKTKMEELRSLLQNRQKSKFINSKL